MIEEIDVRGFQSLSKAKLQLGKLTVLMGSTNVGKSAILRSIKALVENRRGDSFINNEAEQAQVSIKVDNKWIIWVKPKKSSGSYFIGEQASSPEEALRILRLHSIELSRGVKLAPNFQNQLDAPFLISGTNSYKAKVLGEITNASLILLANNKIKNYVTNCKNRIQIKKEDEERYTNEIKRYAGLDSLQADVTVLDAMLTGCVTAIHDLTLLHSVHDRLKKAVEVLNKYNERVNYLIIPMRNLKSCYLYDPNAKKDIDTLVYLRLRLNGIREKVRQAKIWKKKADLLGKLPSIGIVENRITDLHLMKSYVEKINSAALRINTTVSGLDNKKEELKIAEQELQIIKEKLKVCPLCETPIAGII
ncbi:MAG TPA: hypothetical protein ENI23_08110 [bacterium]|nr:hypothetical protein [bacterium]